MYIKKEEIHVCRWVVKYSTIYIYKYMYIIHLMLFILMLNLFFYSIFIWYFYTIYHCRKKYIHSLALSSLFIYKYTLTYKTIFSEIKILVSFSYFCIWLNVHYLTTSIMNQLIKSLVFEKSLLLKIYVLQVIQNSVLWRKLPKG